MARVWADADKTVDRFANLRRIGIDEISYKRHHKYLTIVVDHDSGRLVWAAAGRDKTTLRRFFDALGDGRCALITHVSADAADWIADVVAERCPGAIRCADPFHVVAWATGAGCRAAPGLNDARAGAHRAETRPRPPREESRRGRATSRPNQAQGRPLRVVEEPRRPHRTPDRETGLDRQDRHRPYRAYLLKEACGTCSRSRGRPGREALDKWISWARRCRIPVFVELASRILTHRDPIDAALDHGLSQGLIESTNTKIRVLTRIAFGFHNAEALIALAMLALGGHRPALPGRA